MGGNFRLKKGHYRNTHIRQKFFGPNIRPKPNRNDIRLSTIQVANNTSGRGVLRLIQFHAFLNLICLPVICADIIILAYPVMKMPRYMCACLEWALTFIWINGSFRGLVIALGR